MMGVVEGTQQTILVVPEEPDDGGRSFGAEPENAIDTRAGISAAIDVVAEQDDGVPRLELRLETIQQVVERRAVPVHVPDRNRRHVSPSLRMSLSDVDGR